MSLQSKNRVVKWVDEYAEVANIQPEYEENAADCGIDCKNKLGANKICEEKNCLQLHCVQC